MRRNYSMRDNEYRLHQGLKKLRMYQAKGQEGRIWKLSKVQLEFYGRYYEIEPFRYTITTRPFSQIHHIKNPLIKDVHYAYKRGKKTLTKRLSEKDREVLDAYGVKYKVCQYHIVLNKG